MAGLDPSPSTSTAAVTQKKRPAKRPAPPVPPFYSSCLSRQLKRLAEEEQDPTSVVATLRVLNQRIPVPTESRWQVMSLLEQSYFPSYERVDLLAVVISSLCFPFSSSPSGQGSSQSSTDQKPVEAPVVPFGLDLYYWGQEQPNAGKIIK